MSSKTSWKHVSNWYDSLVGEQGHFYHKSIIIPHTLELLHLTPESRLLDIGCGQGVLSRNIPQEVEYLGLDIASSLIEAAKRYASSKKRVFLQADLTKPWPNLKKTFTHAACILALQNMETPEIIFNELAKVLEKGACAIFVLNHPSFRIPRKSSWNFHEASKTQTREIFSYMTPLKIPIVTTPGKSQTSETWSFHYPLSHYAKLIRNAGFYIVTIEEWCSPKVSTGKAAPWENRARGEFPLFMALLLERA